MKMEKNGSRRKAGRMNKNEYFNTAAAAAAAEHL